MRALGVGVDVGLALALALASPAGCSGPAAPTDPAASPGASEAAPADATLRAAFDGDIAVSAGSGARPALTWPEVEGARDEGGSRGDPEHPEHRLEVFAHGAR